MGQKESGYWWWNLFFLYEIKFEIERNSVQNQHLGLLISCKLSLHLNFDGSGASSTCDWKFSHVHSEFENCVCFLICFCPRHFVNFAICYFFFPLMDSTFDFMFFSLTFLTGYEFDYVFDWTIMKYQQAAQQARVQAQLCVSICHYLSAIHFAIHHFPNLCTGPFFDFSPISFSGT